MMSGMTVGGVFEESAEALEALLNAHGIAIVIGSQLERHVLSIYELVESKRQHRLLSSASNDVRAAYRTLIGMHEMSQQILAVAQSPDFGTLVPHLRLLNDGHVLQNAKSDVRDDATNKLFELMVGAAALRFAEDVELDHPVRSRGDNPDVILTTGGVKWGVACKVLHSPSAATLMNNIETAVDQIDRSAAEKGIVAINTKNILPHEDVWPLAPIDGIAGSELATSAWNDCMAPLKIVRNVVRKLSDELNAQFSLATLEKVFAGKRCLPGILFWSASATAVIVDNKPVPCTVRIAQFVNIRPISTNESVFLSLLSEALYPERK